MLSPRVAGVRYSEQTQQNNPQYSEALKQPNDNIPYSQFQQAVQGTLNSTQYASQVMGQVAENLANTQLAQGAVQSYNMIGQANRAARRQNSIDSVMNFTSNALTVYEQMERRRAESDAAKKKEVQQQYASNLLLEANDNLLSRADEMLISERGTLGYRSEVVNLLNKYAPYVSPEDLQSVTALLYEPAVRFTRENAAETRETIQQVEEQRRQQVITQNVVQFSGLFTRLASAPNATSMESLSEEFNQRMRDIRGLSPEDQTFVFNALIQGFADHLDEGNTKLASYWSDVIRANDYSQLMMEARNDYIATGNYDQYLLDEANAALSTGAPDAIRAQDPERQRRFAYDLEEMERSRQSAYETAVIDAVEDLEFSKAEVVTVAYMLQSDPSIRPLLDERWGDNPYYQQAIALSDSVTDLRDHRTEWLTEQSKIQLTIQQLNVDNASSLASWLDTGSNMQSLSSLLELQGLSTMLGSEELATLSALQQGQQVDPAQLQQARQAVIDRRSELVPLLQQRAAGIESQIETLEAQLAPYGLTRPEDLETVAAGAAATMESLSQREREARESARTMFTQSNTPNFELPPLLTHQTSAGEVFLPFNPGAPVAAVYENYRDDRGTHIHDGVDIAVPVNTPIIFYTNGVVEQVREGWGGGYGNYVDIRAADGTLHRFAHLNSIGVRAGEPIVAGQQLGLSGNTGRSTGPHLHWMIKEAGAPLYGEEGTVNPYEYAAGLQSQVRNRQPRNGTQYNDVPERALQNGDGSYIQGNQLHHRDGTVEPVSYTISDPYRRNYAATARSDYREPNNASQNYGYEYLARNNADRVALNGVAQRLGIPTQWLADVIAFETGGSFNPAERNHGGAPAVGLIQFYQDRNTPGYKTVGGRRYSLNEIASMSFREQLNLVESYLQESDLGRQYASPYELLIAVWGGAGNLRSFRNNPESVRNLGDGDIRFHQYTRRLGEHAGRQYAPIYDIPPVHTSAVRGCATCTAILSSGSQIFPHEAS